MWIKQVVMHLWSRMPSTLGLNQRMVQLVHTVDLFLAFWEVYCDFHCDCNSLQSHQQWMRAALSPFPSSICCLCHCNWGNMKFQSYFDLLLCNFQGQGSNLIEVRKETKLSSLFFIIMLQPLARTVRQEKRSKVLQNRKKRSSNYSSSQMTCCTLEIPKALLEKLWKW